MERIELAKDELVAFGATGVAIQPHARVGDGSGLAVDVLRFAPGSRLGRHPTTLWQLFSVIDGSGWVSGGEATRHDVAAGDAVIWEPGELHESGSERGMTVVVIQSPVHPLAAG